MRVALDAMGGELPPEAIVASALAALRADKDLRITFVGDPARLQPALFDLGKLRDRVQTHPSSQVITEEEDLDQALRVKPDSSIARGWQLLVERKVEALVTPSPVPVVQGAGLRFRHFLPHVRRPGLAASLETTRGSCLLIDAGAHARSRPGRPGHLYQFAVMGVLFCRRVLKIDKPRIGLFAGSDPGPELLRETAKLIEASPLQPHFAGPIDAPALFHGAVEVAVCEGATGKMTLATHDGVTTFLADLPGQQRTQPTQQLGAPGPRPLLGVDGICVTVPASAGDKGIGEALAMAARMNEVELNQEIGRELETGPLAGSTSEE